MTFATYINLYHYEKYCDFNPVEFRDEKSRTMWIKLHCKKCKICEEQENRNKKTLEPGKRITEDQTKRNH